MKTELGTHRHYPGCGGPGPAVLSQAAPGLPCGRGFQSRPRQLPGAEAGKAAGSEHWQVLVIPDPGLAKWLTPPLSPSVPVRSGGRSIV